VPHREKKAQRIRSAFVNQDPSAGPDACPSFMGNAQGAECCATRKFEPEFAAKSTAYSSALGKAVRLKPQLDTKITDLVGTWKVEAEEGSLDEYLSLIGVPWVFRKMVVRPISKQPLQTWSMQQGVMVTGYMERGDVPDEWPLVRDEVWRNPITTQLTKRSIVFQDGVLSQTSHGWVDGHVAETCFFVVDVSRAPARARPGHPCVHTDQGSPQDRARSAVHICPVFVPCS
jgi:hypothetical protein